RTDEAPRSLKTSFGSATDLAVLSPARRTTDFAGGLSHETRQASGRAPAYWTPRGSRMSRMEPSSPAAPCRTGNTASGGSSARESRRVASASRSSAGMSRARKASVTRRPERSETSRSSEGPTARTPPCPNSTGGAPLVENESAGLPVEEAGAFHVKPSDDVRARSLDAGGAARDGAPERVPEPDLVLHHGGEAPDALADAVRLGEAVRQP